MIKVSEELGTLMAEAIRLSIFRVIGLIFSREYSICHFIAKSGFSTTGLEVQPRLAENGKADLAVVKYIYFAVALYYYSRIEDSCQVALFPSWLPGNMMQSTCRQHLHRE